MSYKFISEDDDTFKIQHPDGSEFSIAKSAIGSGVHKKIKSLEPIKMADGGLVDDALSSLPPLTDPNQIDYLNLENPNALMAKAQRSPAVQSWTQGSIGPTTEPAILSERMPVSESVPVNVTGTIESNLSQPMEQPSSQYVGSQSSKSENPFALEAKALDAQKTANTQIGQAETQGFEQQAKLQDDLAKRITDVDQKYQPIEDSLNRRTNELSSAIQNQNIDPTRLWNNAGTGNKILAGIGILLSGIGSGLQGHGAQNIALNVIDKEIDRDIDAQKTELGKKQTLFSENLRLLGDARAARAATKAQLLSVAQTQANAIAARSGSKEATAKMQMINAGVDIQKAQLNRQAKMFSMLTNEGGSNPDGVISYLRVYDPPKAKEMEARYVPSIGIGSVPVPEKVRDQLVAHKQLDDAARDLNAWVKTHSTVLPGTPDYNVGAQKAQVLQQLIRHGQLQTVYREGEQPLLDKMVNSNPAGFLKGYSTEPKLKELIESNHRQFNTLKQGYGLPTTKAQLEPVARQTPDGRVALFNPETKQFLRYQ